MPAQSTPHHPSLDNDSYRPEPAIVLPPVPFPWRHVPVAYYRRQVNVAPALAMNFFMPIPVYLQLLTYLSSQKQLYVQCVLQPLVYLLYFIYNSMTLHIPFDDSWTHLIKLTLWCFTFLPGSSWIWQLFFFFLCSYVMPMWFLLILLALKIILMVFYIIVVFKLLVSQYGLRTINRAYLPVALECVFLILSTMLFAFLLSSSHETPNIQNQQMLTSLEEQELFPSNGYIEAKQYYLTANTFPSHKENVPTERSELLPVQRDNEHVVNLTNFVDNDVAVEDQTSQSICRVFDTITNPYPVQEVRHYLERKYEVARFVWSDSSATGTLLQKIFFPDALLSMPSLINKVNWFKYLRAGVQLEVRINSTQFHFGQIMVSWVPYHRGDPADKDYYRSKSFYTCSWNNAMTISAAQSNSLTFNIPYTAPQSYMYLHGLGQPVIDPSCQIGTVFFHAMTPLLSSTPTATSDVDIVVYASFTDIDLAAYIPEVSSPMRGQSKTFMKEATVSSEARQKAQLNTNVGVPEALITARDVISTVVGSAKEILSLGQDVAPLLPLLLDKPLNEQLTQPVIVSVGQDVPNGDGTDSSTKLSLQREAILSAKTGFLTDATGFPLLPELMQRPALMDIFTWTSVQAVGSNVSWVADPMICKFAPDGTNYIFHPTPLSYFCSPFRFWRGSIKFKFQFRTSGFTTARFRVWHIPAGIDVADLEAESGDVVTALLDVRGDTDFDFNVPYLKPTFWSRNAGYRTAANAVDDMRIVVSLVTTPASSDVSDDSPIYMIVWVAAGEDFQVNQLVRPTEAGLRIDGISALMAYNTTPAAGPSGVMRGQSINVAFNKPYESIIPGVSYTMERGLVAPESPCHLVECLKRYTGSTFIPTEDGLGVHADLNNPMSGKSVVDTLTPDSGQHLPPYFISPFVYWRGGLRRRLYAHITGNYGWLIANLQDTGNTLDNGALVVPGADDKGCASVEIPWYLPIPFRPLIGAINLPEEDVGSLYFYSSNNQALLYTLGLQAVAEDFQLGYLTGVSDVYRPIAPMKDSPKKKHPP